MKGKRMKKENLKMMKMTDYCEGINPTLYPPLNFRGGRNRWRMNMSHTSSGRVKAFTLAETLITLTILGVIAAITVPMLINKQMEAANRTKVKKAMANYEKALNQMIIDNDVKGDIAGVLNTVGCTITSPYFKKINGDGCIFQTADKVWWDITNIEQPLISLKDEITDENSAALRAKADSLDKDKTSFVMVGEIKNGILRINDKGVTLSSTNKGKYLDKLYSFMNNVQTEDIYGDFRGECTCSMQSMLMATQTLQSDDCKSCTCRNCRNSFCRNDYCHYQRLCGKKERK